MFQVNGKLTNKINIKDRVVQYGDGVFETIAVKKNSVEFWKEHYRRLSQGCRVLKIKCPSELFLRKEITNFIKKITESIMLDFNDNVIEGTMSNIFGIKKIFSIPL